jgi:flagellar assembly protein FliH
MSSRLHQPDETPHVEPLIWRPAHSSAQPDRPAKVVDEAAELRAQMAHLQQQYEQRVREAHAAGLREGEAAGRSRAAAEVQPVIDRLARSIEEMAGLRARLRAEAEGDLVQLSLAIARRVLRREIAIDPEALHGLILAALQKLQGQEIARVRVHPSHAGAVTACLRQNLNAEQIQVIADPSREIGAVIFETQRGNLDAGVESQLQEIERGLADRLRTQGTERRP